MERNEDTRHVAHRRYSAQFKAQVLGQCAQPGARVTDVAASHGLPDTTVHRWLRQASPIKDTGTPAAPAFVSVALTDSSLGGTPPLMSLHSVQLTFEKGGVLARVQCTAGDCAALLREVLR